MGKQKKGKNRLEQIKQLEKDIKANPDLLKDLVFNPKKTLPKLDYLDDELKNNIGKISLFELVTGLSGVLDKSSAICGESTCGNSDTCQGPGGTCSDTCKGSTCGSHTCSDTCGRISSCADSCSNDSCNAAGTYGPDIPNPEDERNLLEKLILFSDDTRGMNPRSFRSFTRYSEG